MYKRQVSGIVAQCAGARDYERIRKVVYQAIGITVGVTLVLVLIVELTAPQLVAVFTPDDPCLLYTSRCV